MGNIRTVNVTTELSKTCKVKLVVSYTDRDTYEIVSGKVGTSPVPLEILNYINDYGCGELGNDIDTAIYEDIRGIDEEDKTTDNEQ